MEVHSAQHVPRKSASTVRSPIHIPPNAAAAGMYLCVFVFVCGVCVWWGGGGRLWGRKEGGGERESEEKRERERFEREGRQRESEK